MGVIEIVTAAETNTPITAQRNDSCPAPCGSFKEFPAPKQSAVPGLAPRPKFLLVFAQVLSCQAQTLQRSHCCRGTVQTTKQRVFNP